MDSILDVKEELVARSRTESLDDLKSKGRTRVKVIRAEHIAAMVHEAVQRALEGSGMIAREDVDKLVERSQGEFRDILQERERQLSRARDAMLELEELKSERVRLQASLQEVMTERQKLRDNRDFSTARIEELELEVARQSQRVEELEAQLATSRTLTAPVANEGAAAAGGTDLMMRLMNEVAELRANVMAKGGPQTPAEQPASEGLTAAIDKLAGSLGERLDKFGRRIGISSAVEAQDVKFDALFERDASGELESNMDSVQVKKKTEGSIHANLERLRKLKGNG